MDENEREDELKLEGERVSELEAGGREGGERHQRRSQ